MEPTFRRSMSWLHTWAGVTLGGLLFAIFWMGTLAVFDKEIDRWMMPETRQWRPETSIPWDALRASLRAAVAVRAPIWSVALPTERQPTVQVMYRDANDLVVRYLAAAEGAELRDPGTLAGSRFLYPFHVHLHLAFGQLGYWLVGLGGMAMLVLCICGVIIHRKIFADFFVLRADRQSRRVMLDLHNVAGVLGLPFHIAITLSGLITFYAIYFPSGWQAVYTDRQAFNAEAYGTYSRPRSGKPAEIIPSFEAMAERAQQLWSGDRPHRFAVVHPGDVASYVIMYRPYERHVTASSGYVYFDAATSALLHHRDEPGPVMTAQRFVAGLHLIQFRHWTLRWMYFALGLAGCVLIATGYLFWLESRRKTHAQLGLSGVRIVEGLTLGSTMGIIIATLAFFVTNRLLLPETVVLGQQRAALEIWAFYLVWLASFAHAWLRSRRAWGEQCWLIAVLAVTSVLLNALTTGDHLARSLARPHLWAVAGVDLMLLAGAFVAAMTARKLRYRPSGAQEMFIAARPSRLHEAE